MFWLVCFVFSSFLPLDIVFWIWLWFSQLEACYRWCVTGTPISKSPNELFGIFTFLNMDFGKEDNFAMFLQDSTQCVPPNDGHVIHNILEPIAWRSAKSDVESEFVLPKLYTRLATILQQWHKPCFICTYSSCPWTNTFITLLFYLPIFLLITCSLNMISFSELECYFYQELSEKCTKRIHEVCWSAFFNLLLLLLPCIFVTFGEQICCLSGNVLLLNHACIQEQHFHIQKPLLVYLH